MAIKSIFTKSLIILLLFSSCKQKLKTPEGIMPPEKMEQLLLDLLHADEYINQHGHSDSTGNLEKRAKLYQKVFQLHKTSKDEFKKNFTFYQNRPDLLKLVLDSMHSTASKETDRRNIDSLKTLKVDTSLKK